MKKEKELCLIHSYDFNGEMYVRLEDFKEVMERLINLRGENRKLNTENRRYWKDKAEKLKKENLYLREYIQHLELELSIWKKTDLFK